MFEHPYPYQLFAFIVGFALVFRRVEDVVEVPACLTLGWHLRGIAKHGRYCSKVDDLLHSTSQEIPNKLEPLTLLAPDLP